MMATVEKNQSELRHMQHRVLLRRESKAINLEVLVNTSVPTESPPDYRRKK